jgi:hypothetical protein
MTATVPQNQVLSRRLGMKKTGLTGRNRASLKRTVAIAALAVATLFFATATVKADLILNGSFESPVNSTPNSSQWGVTPTSWTISSSIGQSGYALCNGSALGGLLPEHESQYVVIQEGSARTSLSQKFTVPTGGQYLLTWYDNAPPYPYEYQWYTASIIDATGHAAATVDIDDHFAAAWHGQMLSVNLSSGQQYTLKFESGHLLTALDNVSLSPSSVPIPSALLLFGTGLVGLAAIRRRFKK